MTSSLNHAGLKGHTQAHSNSHPTHLVSNNPKRKVLCSISWATFSVPSSLSDPVCSPGAPFSLPDVPTLPSDFFEIGVWRRSLSLLPSHPPFLSSFPQWERVRLLLVCSCLSALPGSLSFLRSPGSFSGSRLLGQPVFTSLLCLASRRPCSLPPALAQELSWLLLASGTAGLGRPPATVQWSLVESLLTSRHSLHGVGAEGRERDESEGGERECETERESWRGAERNCQ